MILHDTPYDLVLQIMRDEADKVDFFRKKEENKVTKMLSRQYISFPFYHTAEYVIPQSRNRYIVWFYLKNKWDKNIKWGNFLEIFSEKGGRTVYLYKTTKDGESSGGKMNKELAIYTDHFFKRYRERFVGGETLSPTELIVRYLSRNYYHIEGLDFQKLNPNSDKYPNGAVHQVEDGLIFITEFDITDNSGRKYRALKHNTFISHELLKKGQQGHVVAENDIRYSLLKEFGIGRNPDSTRAEMEAWIEEGEELIRTWKKLLYKYGSAGNGDDAAAILTLIAKVTEDIENIKKILKGNKSIK